jgi:predicted RNA methylase
MANKNNVVYFDQHYFFPKLNGIHMTEILHTRTSLYSSIPIKECLDIYRQMILQYRIYHEIVKKPTLIDCTANCGASAIAAFCTGEFKSITAFEIDRETYNCLNKNISLYQADIANFCADYTEVYQKYYADIIFIDPPWGGPGYRKHKNIQLRMSDLEVCVLIQRIFDKRLAQMIVLKAPINYTYATIYGSFHRVQPIYRHERHSYNIHFFHAL